mmetsp:Transcript_7543/g.10943  ORF Transcript_7543/g.10943 Transcript_7543/m.10943 type:complete len:228 (+) Transcript_7543:57-740(+)
MLRSRFIQRKARTTKHVAITSSEPKIIAAWFINPQKGGGCSVVVASILQARSRNAISSKLASSLTRCGILTQLSNVLGSSVWPSPTNIFPLHGSPSAHDGIATSCHSHSSNSSGRTVANRAITSHGMKPWCKLGLGRHLVSSVAGGANRFSTTVLTSLGIARTCCLILGSKAQAAALGQHLSANLLTNSLVTTTWPQVCIGTKIVGTLESIITRAAALSLIKFKSIR